VAALFFFDEREARRHGGSVRGGPVELIAASYFPLPPSNDPHGACFEQEQE